MQKLTLAIGQLNFLVGDIEGNAKRIIKTTQQAHQTHQADLVVFPELALTSYPPEDLLFRPHLYERVDRALNEIQQNTTETSLIVGYPTLSPEGRFNAAAFIHEGKMAATYAKQMLPNYTVFDEKRYFISGHQSCVFTLKGIQIGLIICEDLWFEEPVAKATQAGAELIICINASPFAQDKAHARRELLHQRATQFKVPIVYANLVGGQDELIFDGGSFIVDAEGHVQQQAAYFEEDLLIIQIDLKNPSPILTAHPPLPEMLEEEKIYHALVLGVRDYVEKNHFPGAVIGLSGGIDSALTLAIAVDALGKDRVEAVMMPSRFTSKDSLEDAEEEAQLLKVRYSTISIEPIFTAFLSSLSEEFSGLSPDTTEENLQARCRGTLLMAISNKKGAIVLTTGNKSEMAVGYATLYGDMAGGFAVIKDVYKTMVYRLCHYRNHISAIIPNRVLTKAPSAELALNQKDQDKLPPYPVLDDILERYIAKDEDIDTIVAAGFNRNVVMEVVRMINRNEYKRRQAPPGIRITERAFGKDRRYPITSGY